MPASMTPSSTSDDLLFMVGIFWFASLLAGAVALHAWYVWQKRARALQALVDELVDLVPMDIPKEAALRLQGLVEVAYRSGVWDEQYLEPGRKAFVDPV